MPLFSVASQTNAASPATEKRLKSIEKPSSVCINRRCSLNFIADITVLMYAVSSDALMMSSNVNGKTPSQKVSSAFEGQRSAPVRGVSQQVLARPKNHQDAKWKGGAPSFVLFFLDV